jgi:hypothetical protein
MRTALPFLKHDPDARPAREIADQPLADRKISERLCSDWLAGLAVLESGEHRKDTEQLRLNVGEFLADYVLRRGVGRATFAHASWPPLALAFWKIRKRPVG